MLIKGRKWKGKEDDAKARTEMMLEAREKRAGVGLDAVQCSAVQFGFGCVWGVGRG